MKRILIHVFILAIACSFSGCYLFTNSSTYTKTTEAFTNALLNGDYNKCTSLINFNKAQTSADLTTFHSSLDSIRYGIGRDFGGKLDYTFMSAQKKAPENATYSIPPNTTLVYIEYHNTEYIGVLKVLFDDKTGKIDNVRPQPIKVPVPDMTKFWLFGILAVAVIAYNIYTIILIIKSDLKWKWLYCIAVVLINTPALQYNVTQGLNLKLLGFEYFLGVNFQHIGYLGSVWDIGVPLGAMFASFMLSVSQSRTNPKQTSKKRT